MGIGEKIDGDYRTGVWRWINWKTLLTGLILALLTPLMPGVWALATELSRVPGQVEENTKKLQEISPKLDEILGLMKAHLRRDLTIVGKATIADNGSDREGVWLNQFSKASQYREFGRIRVTNLSDTRSGRERTLTLVILGTIKHNDSDVLIEISHAAALTLRASGEEISVRLEPIVKGEN